MRSAWRRRRSCPSSFFSKLHCNLLVLNARLAANSPACSPPLHCSRHRVVRVHRPGLLQRHTCRGHGAGLVPGAAHRHERPLQVARHPGGMVWEWGGRRASWCVWEVCPGSRLPASWMPNCCRPVLTAAAACSLPPAGGLPSQGHLPPRSDCRPQRHSPGHLYLLRGSEVQRQAHRRDRPARQQGDL